MISPVVSVIMATYNHAPYVAKAIESVLSQRYENFEFLIADDGSTDATAEVVSAIKDPRVRFKPHRINRGAGIVTNELIEQASGEFIAVINSDDCWGCPDKLDLQLDVMRRNPALGASFGRVRFIDKREVGVDKKFLSFGSVFDKQNRSQGEWLRYFFEFGNCICHPTMLIRRQCYEELGAYNNNFRQLPDFDMWIRLVKRYPIHISDQEMINFRVLPGKNVSAQMVENSVRTMNEHYIIAESFFNNLKVNFLKEGFADLLRYPDIPSTIHFDIETALLYFSTNKVLGCAYKMVGIRKLNYLLSSQAHCEILKDDYGIDAHWFQARMAEIDVLRPKFVALLGLQKQYLKRLVRCMPSFVWSKLKI